MTADLPAPARGREDRQIGIEGFVGDQQIGIICGSSTSESERSWAYRGVKALPIRCNSLGESPSATTRRRWLTVTERVVDGLYTFDYVKTIFALLFLHYNCCLIAICLRRD